MGQTWSVEDAKELVSSWWRAEPKVAPAPKAVPRFVAEHFDRRGVFPDGDCWVAAPLASAGMMEYNPAAGELPSQSDARKILQCRRRVGDRVKGNEQFRAAFDLDADDKILMVKRPARYDGPELDRPGDWGERWHLHALAITLGVDIISFVPSLNTFSYYCSTGAQLYAQPTITLEQVRARLTAPGAKEVALLTIEYNGINHFEALVPKAGGAAQFRAPDWLLEPRPVEAGGAAGLAAPTADAAAGPAAASAASGSDSSPREESQPKRRRTDES
jgi:hypothetical protein